MPLTRYLTRRDHDKPPRYACKGCLSALNIPGDQIKSRGKFSIAKNNFGGYHATHYFTQIRNKALKTMKKSRFPSKLHEATFQLFLKAPRNLTNKKIAEDTGLSQAWLTDFSKNRIDQIPAGKLEALYNYLSSTPFEI
jgi:DNA-binding Xre family transcriptional regulator